MVDVDDRKEFAHKERFESKNTLSLGGLGVTETENAAILLQTFFVRHFFQLGI
jgi:hypothetical protein